MRGGEGMSPPRNGSQCSRSAGLKRMCGFESTRRGWSLEDKCVPKLKLGNEERKGLSAFHAAHAFPLN